MVPPTSASLTPENSPHRALHPVRLWLRTGLVLVVLMVVVGAITRLTESGLSITDWRPVTGVLPPLTEQDWQNEFDKYKNSPEFLYKNSGFTLQDFKTIFWWEWIHRFIARLIGLVYIVPLAAFWIRRQIPRPMLPGILLIGILGGVQGFLGWYMVKSGLVDEPRVSHFRLAAHLCTALTIAVAIYWQLLRLNPPRVQTAHGTPPVKKSLLWISLLALILQIIYGAFVAGKDAGQLYNTWPRMGDAWIPESVWAAQPWYVNFLENESGLQFFHRTWAWVVYGLLTWMGFRLVRAGGIWSASGRQLILWVHVQVLLGILTLVLAVPLVLGVAHQLVAVFLLLTMVKITALLIPK
ncbi:MAG: COX15/CtaA family protein [Flavobacteriales bacterium]|nr:COX15/CtaA family protein [Flavobacteriales bacterium]